MFLVWLKATITLARHCRLFRHWTLSARCWSCAASEDQQLNELWREGTQATSPAPLSSASTTTLPSPGGKHWLTFVSFFFCQCYSACGVLVAWPGIEPRPPAVEARSLNHWASRKVLSFYLLLVEKIRKQKWLIIHCPENLCTTLFFQILNILFSIGI